MDTPPEDELDVLELLPVSRPEHAAANRTSNKPRPDGRLKQARRMAWFSGLNKLERPLTLPLPGLQTTRVYARTTR